MIIISIFRADVCVCVNRLSSGRGHPGQPAVCPDPHHLVHILLLPASSIQPAQCHRVRIWTHQHCGHGQSSGTNTGIINKTVIINITNQNLCLVCLLLQVKAGLGVNIIGVLAVLLAVGTWGVPLFSLDTYPGWAPVLPGFNSTAP